MHPARRTLTTSQLLVWLGQQQQPDAPIYNMIATFEIAGALDVPAFRAAFQSLVDDCDALRTVIEHDGEAPYRAVRAHLSSGLEVIDFSGAPRPVESYRAWAVPRMRRRLDLATRAFESALIKLSHERFVWYLNQHHIMADAWSTALVFSGTAARYERAAHGAGAAVTSPPSFETFAAAEQHSRSSARGERAARHWRALAHEHVAASQLPYYGRTSARAGTESTRVRADLGRERSTRLTELAREPELRSLTRDVTLFQIFMTVLFAFLHRVTGETRLVVGAPSANRATAEQRATIGLLMEMFALQVDVEPADTFASLLGKVRRESIEFFRHALPGCSDAAAMRASGVVLNYVKADFARFAGLPVDTRFHHAGAIEPHHQLRLQIVDFERSGELTIDLDLDTAVFGEAVRPGVGGHFLALLDAFMDDRDRHLGDVDLLSPAERTRVIVECNDTAAPYASELTLERLFAAQARRDPHRDAVVGERMRLGYGELHQRAVRLAGSLARCGVEPGAIVGIYLERGVDLIVSVMAILEAGAAYLPLDTALPESRRARLLAHAGAQVVITDASLIEDVRLQARHAIVVDGLLDPLGEPAGGGARRRALDDAAYVLYTSGSTGEPKAVLCNHRGVVNLLAEFEARAPLAPGAACAWWTSASFDVSVFEIFSALCFGGTVHVVPERLRADAAGLFEWLRDNAIESGYLPPFLLSQVRELAMAEPGALALRRLLVGVEPIAERTLAGIAAAVPGLRIINGYGPTEATVCATLYAVAPRTGAERTTPIGRPVRNATVYVLDDRRRPAPFGASGELYIGGDGVARGYLADDEATAERFVLDPFDRRSGRRMYRTGDVVRYLADGNLEFLGRVDQQLKIRGLRIEPAEIERVLVRHPAVRDALVRGVDDAAGGKSLVAYLVCREPPGLTPAQWFQHLRPELPVSMIPAAYVMLDAFPLTSSGKVDAGALPRPALDPSGPALDSTPPRTPTERVVAAAFASALGIESVGVLAHFIDLGGDSIQALRIVAMAREAGIELHAAQIFEQQTVAAIAAAADRAPRDCRAPRGPRATDTRDWAARAGLGADDIAGLLSELGEHDD